MIKLFVSWKEWEEASYAIRAQIDKVLLDDLTNCFKYAQEKHGSQTRPGGEPYYRHLIQVFEVLFSGVGSRVSAELKASILHDVVEDTGTSIHEIKEEFGDEVARLVNAVTIPAETPGQTKAETKALYLDALLKAPKDVRCLKLSDRYGNVQRLDLHPRKEKQKSYFKETVEKVIPMAYDLPYFQGLFSEWEKWFATVVPK